MVSLGYFIIHILSDKWSKYIFLGLKANIKYFNAKPLKINFL